MEERFRKAGIRASNSGSVGRHGEHLTTLGLSAAASKQEIKQAYRRLALEVGYIILLPNPSLDIINFWLSSALVVKIDHSVQYHPDVCKGDHCALMFKQVNSAYEVQETPA
jgi:hypothetical protein